jgi:hypothetical protein
MTGTLAQMVALTCHGNALIGGFEHPRFFPKNSTCQYCDSVKFIIFKKPLIGKIKELIVAENPDEWLASLKNRGSTGIRLSRTAKNNPEFSDRMSAGFVGGGGTWKLEVVFPGGTSEFWISRWLVWNQNAHERKIWRVSYGMIETAKTTSQNLRMLSDVKSDFRKALSEIREFSEQQNCGGFTQIFVKALEALDHPEAEAAYHKDLFVPGTLTADAATILKAATHAWVFGGMGSWNDMGFAGDIQSEYERVSENLFQVLNEAIAVAATNSFASGHAKQS